MRDMGDEELMLQAQGGHVHAFELLFERYRGPVFGFIFRMLNGNRQDAEELMQEIFIKLFKARDMYEPRARFSCWLFAIVRNHCVNFLRSQAYLKARRTVSLDTHEFAECLDQPAAGCDQGRQSDMGERLEQAIASLPVAYRDVFLLRAVEGFSHDETARMLGLNPATVRTQFRRARLMLAEKLEGPRPAGGGKG